MQSNKRALEIMSRGGICTDKNKLCSKSCFLKTHFSNLEAKPKKQPKQIKLELTKTAMRITITVLRPASLSKKITGFKISRARSPLTILRFIA